MKTFNLNNRRVRALLGGILLTVSLPACSKAASKNPNPLAPNAIVSDEEMNKNIDYLYTGTELIPFGDLRLADENGKVVESIDGVIIDNKIVKDIKPVDAYFNSTVKSIVINDEILDAASFRLFNINTNEIVTDIVAVFVDNVQYSLEDVLKNYTAVKDNTETEKTETSESTVENQEEYVQLTSEKFYSFVDEVYENLLAKKIATTKENVTAWLLVCNLDKIAKDCKEVITEVIGDAEPDAVYNAANIVLSQIMTSNLDKDCANIPFAEYIHASEFIIDTAEKRKAEAVETRIVEISENLEDKEKFNELVNSLLMDMLAAENELSSMTCGTGYAVTFLSTNVIRSQYNLSVKRLDEANSELIKYFVVFAGDGKEYEDNAKSTGYYRGITNILKECGQTKTMTK